MCGIAGLHLKDDTYRDRLGAMVAGMLRGVAERGPDSAGVAIHSDGLEVLKAVGDPLAFAARIGLATRSGVRALAHTRMATESAVTAAHCHPFAVRPPEPARGTAAGQASAAAATPVDTRLCLVHNGSFANHASIRRRLADEGVTTETDNDSEVAARYLAARLAAGDDLAAALRRLTATFDGFFTLAVTTADSFAVVRDPIACKPAIIAETDRWVAMVSEYRALLGLPGLADAAVFEPEPEEVYLWAS
ncbi:glutamine amidotransferase [Frankia sp. QA3]|uniref:glutamine amidotransferase n=1 Tax=Frankia sp. QA3 TaxID=710111 RepID=UPI000269C460|nr:glutamine amidotransferase [Frankia sp. QA3]EIV93450.1 glucosamine 6-phosphate synthetase, contains amidotransferase and phosphosugar isomerase domains [Frankia sp. QA3]